MLKREIRLTSCCDHNNRNFEYNSQHGISESETKQNLDPIGFTDGCHVVSARIGQQVGFLQQTRLTPKWFLARIVEYS